MNKDNHFGQFFKVLIAVSIISLLSLGAVSTTETETNTDFMALNQIEEGMEGTGKTVVSGTQISDFQVRVVGVIDEPGYLNDFVIIRCTGDAITKSGGISQGMSGSPIYIDGKLIGALSRAAEWSSDPTNPMGLVTPIHTMLKLVETETQKSAVINTYQQEQNKEIKLALMEKYGADQVRFSHSPSIKEGLPSNKDSVVIYSLQAPLMVSGLGDRAFSALKNGIDMAQYPLIYHPLEEILKGTGRRLKEGLSRSGLNFHQVSGNSQTKQESLDLQPGAPFGVGLTRGDISMGALGTVTYKKDDIMLGFGHRFLLNGPSDFFLTKAYVFDTIKSLKASFKLGTITDQVGSVTEDRTQGVRGEIGARTDALNMDLEITNLDLNSTDNLLVDAIKEPHLVGNLTLSVTLEAIDQTLNRIGPGTVRLDYTIKGNGMPQELNRSDIFFSTQDVAVLPSLQLAILIDALANNPFQEADLSGLDVQMQVTENINAGRVFSLKPDGSFYNPGDAIVYQVKISNYRDDITKETGILPLPQDLEAGEYVLVAYGGPQPSEIAPTKDIKTLQDYITYIEDINSYEYLSVELLKPLKEQLVPMSGGYSYQSVKKTDKRYPDRVIYGRKAVSIIIEEKKQEGK